MPIERQVGTGWPLRECLSERQQAILAPTLGAASGAGASRSHYDLRNEFGPSDFELKNL